ncbi:MAG: LysM peptidoglycan-binding domain-containing protein [Methylococcaceae bacterium]
MAFRTILGLIFSFYVSSISWADEILLNPSHPDQYTVVQGDTLWDISGKFLHNPSHWPRLWSQNAQIKNPHLIYPGDTIYFSMVNGRPQLSFAKDGQQAPDEYQPPFNGPCILQEEEVKNGRKDFALTEEGKLAPCIRETDIKQAITLIPTEAIAQFLTSPRVVGANELNNAPYIVDLAGEHLIAGAGDKIYVRSITQPTSLSFTVYREGETYISPETGEILGYEAKYIADTTLQQPGDPATLAITKAKTEIRIGDRVMTNVDENVTLNYFPRPPEQIINGSIISVLNGVSQIGKYDMVVIDKGTKDGLLTGHELDIYQNGRIARDLYNPVKNATVKLPDELAGKLMVFRPFERVSYALVMKASQAIHVLDKVQTP